MNAVGLAIHQKKPVKAYEIIGSALDPTAQVTNNILTVKELLAPLSREEVGLVRCLGLNYADHAVCSLLHPNTRHSIYAFSQPIGRGQPGQTNVSDSLCRLITPLYVMRTWAKSTPGAKPRVGSGRCPHCATCHIAPLPQGTVRSTD